MILHKRSFPAAGGSLPATPQPRIKVLAARYPVLTGLIAAVYFGGLAGLALSTVTVGVVLWGLAMGIVFGLCSVVARKRLPRNVPEEPADWAVTAPPPGRRWPTGLVVALWPVTWLAATVFFWLAGHLRPAPIGWLTSAVFATVAMAIATFIGYRKARTSRPTRSPSAPPDQEHGGGPS
ncbi:hypothetical protein [Streptomyces spiralis]|uniref:hypothetical protein n=1 Tax=Streptomyces spiralis TaxID=66376 RepID=UPI0033DDA469